ncbi:MAG: phosphoribosylformylglycinamidine cyclo-ligase [Elusimicrobia bacterium]|nr:phosphoribosylformylglycinamidine cyclo-ligase [Elusimicrobiota bacterium]MBD3412381.1 phosphoribosylformylglycinamidine cyclo-ligase [Elusimicrobiota bacterium]
MTTYRSAGVNINAGNRLVKKISRMVPGIGGFSGSFPLYSLGYKNPLLVSSADGVGTKLKIAGMLDNHATVGIDLVAMNVNDLICCGAQPLFFLDYFACGKLSINQALQVIKGIVTGCKQAACTLLGGETAEMPGFYASGEYDLAGFAVGVVERDELIDGTTIQPGELIIGIPSSGLHSNGFSLVRKILSRRDIKRYAASLLTPTRIYVKTIKSLLKDHRSLVKGMAHITGGGFYDNIPRILPQRCDAIIQKKSWSVPDIFECIQRKGSVRSPEMFRTFNMGIGMIIVCSPVLWPIIKRFIPDATRIGHIDRGSRKVKLI